MLPNQKPIFITGASGSIGSRLASRLSEEGTSVRAMVRGTPRAAGLAALANVEIVSGDLSQPESLHNLMEGCSLVYHCAAKLTGSNRAAFHTINVAGTQALIGEAVRAGVERFVHLSTIGVYGFAQAENITEEFPLPVDNLPYVTTKQEAERMVWAAEKRIPISVARLGDVVGPGQYTWTIDFIQKINQGILKPPTEAASGTLNPVYIDNLIDALLLLGTHPAATGQAFNVVDGTPIRTSDYIRRLTRMAGKRTFAVPTFVLRGAAALLMAKDRLRGHEALITPGEVRYLLHKATISREKIRVLLGWEPAIKADEAFERTERWLRSAGYLPEKNG